MNEIHIINKQIISNLSKKRSLSKFKTYLHKQKLYLYFLSTSQGKSYIDISRVSY